MVELIQWVTVAAAARVVAYQILTEKEKGEEKLLPIS
jgi:hypothetical protein